MHLHERASQVARVLTMTWPSSSTPLDLFSRTVSTFDARMESLVELRCDDFCQRRCPNPNPHLVTGLYSHASSHLRIPTHRRHQMHSMPQCGSQHVDTADLRASSYSISRDTLNWTRDEYETKTHKRNQYPSEVCPRVAFPFT
jgi:hypothetical protein